jgi:hypothetical protein
MTYDIIFTSYLKTKLGRWRVGSLQHRLRKAYKLGIAMHWQLFKVL